MATLGIENIRSFIMRKLGHPVVCVELDEEQVDQAITDAFIWWSAYRGWYKEAELQLVIDQSEYDLSAVDPPVVGIIDIYFVADYGWDLEYLWEGFLDVNGYPYDWYLQNEGQGGFYSGIVQWQQMRETGARVLSVDADWIFNSQTKVLTITPRPSDNMVAQKIVYKYETPFDSKYLSMVPPQDAFLIRERALAESKYILGRIRGKYTGGLPAAQGNVSLDGDNLLQEAQADFDRLDRELMALMPPPAIITG